MLPVGGSIFCRPLPSAGSPWGGFPDFAGTMGRSDFRTPLPPRFVAFAWRYHAGDLSSCSLTGSLGRGSRQPGAAGCHAGCPFRPFAWRCPDLSGSWGTLVNMPWSMIPVRPTTQVHWGRPVLPSVGVYRLGPDDAMTFETRSHGLLTRCLRFAVGDRSPPTQDSLPAGDHLCRVGFRLPQGSNVRFGSIRFLFAHLAPPYPSFS